MFKPSIEKQIDSELYLCERQLLEAEGVLERAAANVEMLQRRRERLEIERDKRANKLGYSEGVPTTFHKRAMEMVNLSNGMPGESTGWTPKASMFKYGPKDAPPQTIDETLSQAAKDVREMDK